MYCGVMRACECAGVKRYAVAREGEKREKRERESRIR
jgi:hypothetical protein